jgi:formate dehydrogenase subunit gamma
MIKPADHTSPVHQDAVAAALDAHAHRPGAMLPILHDIQSRLGHVPSEAVPVIADRLNLTRAEVHGVVTFYHEFRAHAPGKHVVKLCRAEACQAVGGAALEAHACRTLGVDWHGTTTDGEITLEAVFCLGNCALGPSALVDGEPVGRVTPESFDAIVADLRGGAK